ncbi:ribosome silencing factor [Labilibaculum sp.]|uniref:ribosome silencing factor n=1 Tax=Labilibaculum sp. TaxID=2060723 RepID=UPI003564956D
MIEKKGNTTEELVDTLIEGLQKNKAIDIVKIDLRNIESSVCKYFLICHGTSTTHVNGIAASAEEYVRKTINEKPWRFEGHQNSQWILLDYSDVVVHVFQKEYRDFYRLENLWADATVTKIQNA